LLAENPSHPCVTLAGHCAARALTHNGTARRLSLPQPGARAGGAPNIFIIPRLNGRRVLYGRKLDQHPARLTRSSRAFLLRAFKEAGNNCLLLCGTCCPSLRQNSADGNKMTEKTKYFEQSFVEMYVN